MTLININRREIEKICGNSGDDELEKFINLFGTNVEDIKEDEIILEIAPNRPDLLSSQGFLRAIKAFSGKEPGLKKYTINKPEKDFKIKIDSSVSEVRPFTTCAIVKNLFFDDEKIKTIIDLQEKLHSTIGRNRKKSAIGVYPLEKIKLPITYTAKKPDEIKFIPLGYDNEMTANEILQRHPTGREYAHLLQKHKKFPVFIDANKKILSMPPIINSHDTGKITENTREVFIECSGFDFEVLKKTLNIIVSTLIDMGGRAYSMELNYNGKKAITPDFSYEKFKINIENVNSLLGLNLKEKEIERLLLKMGYDYKKSRIKIPPWRTDILHEVDIIEDLAIAYGYNNFQPEIPQISTIAYQNPESKIKNKIAEILSGIGLTEVSTYHLIKEEEAKLMKIQDKKEVENSKTEYKILRPNLLIPALRILSENNDAEYPHKIFELGAVFSNEKKNRKNYESGIAESEHLIIAISPANFTEMKQIFNYLIKMLGINYELQEFYKEGLIRGRIASINLNKNNVGYLGELHPETLKSFGIKMPVSVIEISLNEIFNLLK